MSFSYHFHIHHCTNWSLLFFDWGGILGISCFKDHLKFEGLESFLDFSCQLTFLGLTIMSNDVNRNAHTRTHLLFVFLFCLNSSSSYFSSNLKFLF
uniref:Uncharacterized protein n=1 Tax=Rhizophora mucronata TaxID=61149 RepID=A0A2P2K8L1_RHIMU